ncbi:MAG: DNA-binding protein WhiA [Ruminococcus sp.]|nr:DNA-binding protein WhiA [Ruminococcus sp.]
MSYSTDLKTHLTAIETKRQCCRDAYECGVNLRPYESVCAQDTGAWLRGAFVACGTMSDPAKQYYICFRTKSEALALIREILESEGIPPSDGVWRHQQILYLRDSSKIEDFMALIGASRYSLQLMELKVIKGMSADANRRTNADLANCSRAADASARQVAAIKKLIKTKKLQLLSAELVETAEIRLQYPEMSLDELKNMFPTPITKSGLNHRLHRLTEEADGE